jgi:hypothetical protein
MGYGHIPIGKLQIKKPLFSAAYKKGKWGTAALSSATQLSNCA